MCTNRTEKLPSPPLITSSKRRHRSKKSKVQVFGLTNRRRSSYEEKEGNKDVKMELKNLKLYLENQSIVEENEKLRKKAHLLHQENLALMSELEKKVPRLINRVSTTLFPFHNAI